MANYSEQQIKKALKPFFNNPEAARKFAACMREGLEQAKETSNKVKLAGFGAPSNIGNPIARAALLKNKI